MRYLLIIAFAFVSFTASCQIRARQIRADSNYTTLQTIVNDTSLSSSTYRLGKFVNIYTLLQDLLDSLGVVYPSDTDWLKYGSTDIPDNDDTIYHRGVVFIEPTESSFVGTGIFNVRGRFHLTDGGSSLYIGESAGNLGSFNIGIGKDVLKNGSSNISTRYNTGIGFQALENNTSGQYNSAIGFLALNDNTTGSRNTALGSASLVANTTGARNFALGAFTMNANTTGSGNIAIGAAAAFNVTGSKNVMIGDSVGYNSTGSNALMIDNSPTTEPLIKGDFAADTLEINGKLGYSTDAGNPDRLAGLDGQQFTSVIIGYGLDFANDTLYVDTTGFGGSGGSGATNLSIQGAAPTFTIASSSGTDVYVTSDTTINLSELAPDTLMFKVDTNVMATQYDLTTLDTDDDWYIVGTTDEPTAITDTMFHTGLTGIGENTLANMYGQLTVGIDGGSNLGVVTYGYGDSSIPLAFYSSGDSTGWEFRTVDDNSFYLKERLSGADGTPFWIETQHGETLILLSGGDVGITGYPNTRDDGTAANFLGTDLNGVIKSYDIDDVISEWYLVGSGTPGSEAITDGETVTFTGGGINTVTRSTNTITITGTEVDGSTTNEAWTIDASTGDTEVISNQTVLFAGGGINSTNYNSTTNTLTITGTEVDGSTTNELNTIEEGNVSVQTGNITLDFQTLFDVATDGATEVNVSLDLGEATTVTTVENDDYLIMHDAGLSQHQKILWTNLTQDVLTIRESNTALGTGNDLDFGTGFDVTGVGPTFDIDLDLGEFTTDASPEGDEYVILYDPSSATEEKTLITNIGDTNFAEDNLTFTGNRVHNMDIYSLTLQGSVNNMTLLDQNGGTGDNLILASELGAGTGVTGGISFEYQNSGTPTDQFDIEANKRSSTKQTLEIQAEQDTDAHLTFEKNSGLADNTTESHFAVNGGIAFTQNYEWTATAADLTLDRSYWIVNVSGSGAIGDEINLPEVINNGDNWASSTTDAQVQVGQEYVISNFRAATDVVIRTFTGDVIYDNTGAASGSTYNLGPNESIKIRCVRLSSGVGSWFVYH